MTQLSYVHGASDTPFIGHTIGVHFDRVVERFGDRDAVIVRHQQVRWTYHELKDAFAAGPWRSGSSAAIASACGRRTMPNG
jgi:fatty-acyl-CoA synthase